MTLQVQDRYTLPVYDPVLRDIVQHMTYILVIWQVIAIAGTQFSTHPKSGWTPIGDFDSAKTCQEAARDLGMKPEEFRCLKKRAS